jgi:hypothetical protein
MRFIYYFITLLLLFSCEKDKNYDTYFENYRQIKYFNSVGERKIVPLSDTKFDMPPQYMILLQDKYLLFSNFLNQEDKTMKILDIEKQTIVSEFGIRGQGPGEFTGIMGVEKSDSYSDRFYIYDISLQRLTFYRLTDILHQKSSPDSLVSFPTESGIPFIVKAIDSLRYLCFGNYYPYRYCMYDSLLLTEQKFQRLPVELSEMNKYVQQYSLYHFGIAFHPSHKKIAVGMANFDMIQVFDNAMNTIISIHGPDLNPPLWLLDTKSRNAEGYIDLDISDKFIYGVYSGEMMENENDWIKSYGTRLFLLNWEGDPIKELKLSHRVGDIAVSAALKKIFLVYYDEEYFRIGTIELLEDEI